jgi:hypothetical protein
VVFGATQAVRRRPLATAILLCALLAPAVRGEEEYRVYTDPPRLFLNAQRLRLLKRERERQSIRWQQFEALVAGGAALPEPGFAWALYYRVSGQTSFGKQAVEWALSDTATDLRHLALVFDWCGPLMTESETQRLGAKIERALPAASATDARGQSSRVLAAIAIADRLPDRGESILRQTADWWRGEIVKKIEAGQPAIPRGQLYYFFELLHAFRDNLKLDLREDLPAYFNSLPAAHIAGHYPAPYPAAENEYRIPVFTHEGEPDLADAVMSRAAGLEMVAYDSNDAETQFLQGWLMQDRFVMRSALGAPYEFLWANPYQPGLSYFQMPLIFHSEVTGELFARTSWDEDAVWLGYFDRHLQIFRDGKIVRPDPASMQPIHVDGSMIVNAPAKTAARLHHVDAENVFILGLEPQARYDVEIDDQEVREQATGASGALVLNIPGGIETAVSLHLRHAIPEAHPDAVREVFIPKAK